MGPWLSHSWANVLWMCWYMIYVLKTKFEWAQHTQKNTKAKTTTVRTQNNAASAFISLDHYMCSDKTSFFFFCWHLNLPNTTNSKITWWELVMLAHTYNPWALHVFKSSMTIFQGSWSDDSVVKHARYTILWLESNTSAHVTSRAVYVHPYLQLRGKQR